MGILNVTPDSFSGDGRFGSDAIVAADKLASSGAHILDVGAESTRPGAKAVHPDEEWSRLAPLLSVATARDWRARVRLSVDTRNAQTAARALDAGADIINDVSALTNPAYAHVLGKRSCDIVTMHALSIPANSAVTLASDCDVVQEILRWKIETARRAKEFGIAPERLIFDPGIGFGKTAAQSLRIIMNASALVSSGGRWLFGHSRKSFLRLFSDAAAPKRDDLTLAFSACLAQAGVFCIRVHDVNRHVQLLHQL
jgi:dihydropteroate synthase